LVVAVAALLVWPWALPGAEAARGADARAAAGQHRLAEVAAPARPRRATPAPPRAGRQARPAAPRESAAAARRPAAAARRPVSAPAEGGAPVDPAARNPLSSARGLMQFTRGTWLEAVRDFGPRHGLARHAALLSTGPRDGTVSARDPRHLARVLELRDDPRLSAIMAAERVSNERPGLEHALGRAAAPADLHAVHLLGPAGARRFLAELHRTPSRPALETVGQDSVGANRGVFVARGGTGRPLSLAEVYAALRSGVEEQRAARGGRLAAPAGPSTPNTSRYGASWVEMAEAR
jgi:hypothetical protein